MIYVLKIDDDFMEKYHDKYYGNSISFKDLYMYDDKYHDGLHIYIYKYTTKQEISIKENYWYEDFYIIYNDYKKKFAIIKKEDFEVIQDNINYEPITIGDFSIVNHW